MKNALLLLFLLLGDAMFFGYFSFSTPLLQSSAIGLFAIFVFVGVFSLALRNKPFRLSFAKPTRNDMRAGFFVFALLFPVALAGRLFDPSYDGHFVTESGLATVASTLLFLAALPLLVAREELFFRFFQSTLSLRSPTALALVVVAVHGAILHVPLRDQSSWTIFFSVLLGSAAVAWVYAVTKNFWAAATLHLTYDLFIFGQILLHVYAPTVEWFLWSAYALAFAYAVFHRATLFRIAENIKTTPIRFPDAVFFLLTALLPILLRLARD